MEFSVFLLIEQFIMMNRSIISQKKCDSQGKYFMMIMMVWLRLREGNKFSFWNGKLIVCSRSSHRGDHDHYETVIIIHTPIPIFKVLFPMGSFPSHLKERLNHHYCYHRRSRTRTAAIPSFHSIPVQSNPLNTVQVSAYKLNGKCGQKQCDPLSSGIPPSP